MNKNQLAWNVKSGILDSFPVYISVNVYTLTMEVRSSKKGMRCTATCSCSACEWFLKHRLMFIIYKFLSYTIDVIFQFHLGKCCFSLICLHWLHFHVWWCWWLFMFQYPSLQFLSFVFLIVDHSPFIRQVLILISSTQQF